MVTRLRPKTKKMESHQNSTSNQSECERIDTDSALNTTNDTHNLDQILEQAIQTPSRYYLLYTALGIANASDASEILCLSYILSDETFQSTFLKKDFSQRGSYLAGSVFFGMLIGGLLMGVLGDDIGRKPSLLIGLGLNAVSSLISTMSPNVLVLTVLRCIAGLGIGAGIPPLFTLAAELAPPSRRGFYITFVASFWMVGSIFVSGLALGCFMFWEKSWRVFLGLATLPSVLGFGMVWVLVPESPRFLVRCGRVDDEVKAVRYLVQSMNAVVPRATIDGFHRGNIERSIEHSYRHRPKHSIHRFWMGIKLIYSTKSSHLRSNTICLQTLWAMLCFGSYGLAIWINAIFQKIHLQNIYVCSFLFALANLPGNIASALLLDRVGRHNVLLWSMILASFSLMVFAHEANQIPSSPIIIVLSACSYQAFTIASWNAIDCMTSESFPTSIRSTSLGLCTASGRVGAMLAQFVNGALVQRDLTGVLILVSSMALLFGGVLPKLWMRGNDRTGRVLEEEVGNGQLELSCSENMALMHETYHVDSLNEERDSL